MVGGCIGTDAHTVGIDAILNIKGFAGEKGLEYYRELKVVNLGAQVSVPQLVEAARAEKADAVLVSQVVTQRDAHLLNTREMSAAFREAYPAGTRPLLVVGGPRFDESDGRRARRRPRLQPGYDARRGRVLPRPPHHQPSPGGVMTARASGLASSTAATCPTRHAHYAGNLVDGAYSLGLFGDVATEMCIRTDGDEGLFASYSDVQFRAPVRAGDVLEITCEVVKAGTRVACHGVRRPRGRARRGDARGTGRGSPAGGAHRRHHGDGDGRRTSARLSTTGPARRVEPRHAASRMVLPSSHDRRMAL